MKSIKDQILVVGANGKTGRRVNQRLQSLGYATRAVSRSTTPSFDWEKPQTWPATLHDMKAAYVTYQPDLALPQAEGQIKHFIHMAKEQGVEHVVLLSGRGEEGAIKAEQALISSGLTWNIVRSSWFMQNFSESFMLDGILSGELILPAGKMPEPFIDADDIADVVTATLTEPGHENKLYEVTGPQLLTFAQVVDELAKSLGRPIKFTQVSIDDYISMLQADGVPEDYQWLLRELFTVVFDGRNQKRMLGVQQALLRPATNLQTYIQKTITTGIWSVADQKQVV